MSLELPSWAQRAHWIWADGELKHMMNVQINPLAPGLQYAQGCVFEGIRFYEQHGGGSAIFRLDDHLERLRHSAKAAGFLEEEIPSLQVLRRACIAVVIKNHLKAGYIRPFMFVDVGEGKGVGAMQTNPIRVMVAAWEWGAYLGDEAQAQGARVTLSDYVLPSHKRFDGAKMGAKYGFTSAIKRRAIRDGFDEALVLNKNPATGVRFIAEGTGENLFVIFPRWVGGGVGYKPQLITPPAIWGVLPGITRDTVMRIVVDRFPELCFKEDVLSVDQRDRWLEAFFTGTAAEVTPIGFVDDMKVGGDRDRIWAPKIAAQYKATVTGAPESFQHEGWLTDCSLPSLKELNEDS